MQGFQPTLSPSEHPGQLVPTDTVRLTTHAAVTKGYVYAVDFTTIDTTTGLADTTIAVATAHGKHGVLVVAMEVGGSAALSPTIFNGVEGFGSIAG